MSTARRILCEIHPRTVGGTEQFLARLLPRLHRERYEPIAIASRSGSPARLLRAAGVPALIVNDYLRGASTAKLVNVIRRERIDLVQSNYYASALARAASIAGVPHLWRLGGHVEVGSGARTADAERLTLEVIGLLSDSIVCNSAYVRTQFAGNARFGGVVGGPIRVIRNGVPAVPPAVHKRVSGECRVAMIAHFTPQKRHEDFIAAAEQVAASRVDVSFTILGREYANNPESRRYAGAIGRRAQALVSQGRLRIATAADASRVLRDFDVMVLPGVRESLSNAILEAMAAGLPVIAARSGGNPELIRDGVTGLLVEPMRPDALASAIFALASDRRRMQQMGAAARRRALSVFSIERCARQYERVYDDVLRTARLRTARSA